MDSTDYFFDGFKNYANFKGRATRPQFWYFILYSVIFTFIFSLINKNLRLVYELIALTPTLALGVRRLHDIGKSGWWMSVFVLRYVFIFATVISLYYKFTTFFMIAMPLNLILTVLYVIVILFLIRKSEEGNNRYGSVSIKTKKQI